MSLPAGGAESVGTTFPKGFPVILDHSLRTPVIGFGGRGPAKRTPVIFLHGNNDTPYPTDCNSTYGKVQAFAQYFADLGYRLSELWALGYQGDQCDLQTDQSKRAAVPHTATANVPDLRAFVKAVLRYTGARQVDIVGHSLGSTLPREWMRQDRAHRLVRRFVGVDGPEHGIINCSPSPRNYYVTIGFNPDSPVCREFGSDHTPLLRRLNRVDETPGSTRYMMIANADTSFVYIDRQDGVLPPVPPEDREGNPHDFSKSARLKGARIVLMTGQGQYDETLLASHTGIVNSPDVWATAYRFLTAR
jgi:pimeloyl-ACP methyl ester carboxylesterase